MPLVSISDDQRQPLRRANWVATVHHGLPRRLPGSTPPAATTSPSSAGSRRKSASIARSRSPAARACRCASPPRSIRADEAYLRARSSRCSTIRSSSSSARSAKRRSRVPRQRLGAAVPDRLARAVRPGDDRGHGVRHAGDRLPRGSVPEVIEHGVTGFIVDERGRGEPRSAQAHLEPPAGAPAFRASASRATRMARDYLAVYRKLRKRRRGRADATAPSPRRRS